MFEITEAAAEQVRNAAEQGGTEGMALRMAARMKEDGSIDYLMGFDEAKAEDIRVVSNGIEVVMEPQYAPLLDETVMDYAQLDDGELRFIFLNPNDANYVPAAKTRSR
ncbi:HesB/IscA family protein [Sedimenticola hydrogenitrophicus]|jgi:iron-sulfur cluster assembly protein|uniref:HesB/IscA family protein n=1 Tax=Sedimenticola hydrogenitrophicus TaxID=2967975 RepID=UPI0021A6B661|nr:iron-sulfur cluster biosynthesis family protein [Sedimenticola hydrogenitrophicus]